MSDQFAHRFPISVKAVIQINGKYPLLRNERNEWELPGGKLESGEEIVACVERETLEELGLNATATAPLNNWVYYENGTYVVIMTYLLKARSETQELVLSDEHKELGLFSMNEAGDLRMPEGYLRSIELAEIMLHDV